MSMKQNIIGFHVSPDQSRQTKFEYLHIQIAWIWFTKYYNGVEDIQWLRFSLFSLKQCYCMSSEGLPYSTLLLWTSENKKSVQE